jgi:hypothetical protein
VNQDGAFAATGTIKQRDSPAAGGAQCD